MRAEPALTTPTAAPGPTSPEAHGPGGPANQGATDGNRAGEPRSDAAVGIIALLTPSQGEEPRSGTRQDWFGTPDMLHAQEYEGNLHTVAVAISRRDPRLAPDPGLDPFVANLLKQACLSGDLPPPPEQ